MVIGFPRCLFDNENQAKVIRHHFGKYLLNYLNFSTAGKLKYWKFFSPFHPILRFLWSKV